MSSEESPGRTQQLYTEYRGFIGAAFGGGIGVPLSTGWPIEVALGTGFVLLLIALTLVALVEGGRYVWGGFVAG